MEMVDLPPELNEIRKIILSSHLTTCFLILEELAPQRRTRHYERFRQEWIETYKNAYKLVSKMKTRKSSRELGK